MEIQKELIDHQDHIMIKKKIIILPLKQKMQLLQILVRRERPVQDKIKIEVEI